MRERRKHLTPHTAPAMAVMFSNTPPQRQYAEGQRDASPVKAPQSEGNTASTTMVLAAQ
jgi:hypothetical protein